MLASIPQLTLTSYAVNEGTATLALQAVVSDADEDLSKVEFSLDNFATIEGEVLVNDFVPNGNGTFTANFTLDLIANGLTNGPSTNTYYARVTDLGTNASTDQANISIDPVNPEILHTEVTGGEDACSPVVFDVLATDAVPQQSTTLTIQLYDPTFTPLTPIIVPGSGGHFLYSTSSLAPGNYFYLLQVTDNDGDSGGGVGDFGSLTVGAGGAASLTASIENEPSTDIAEGDSITLDSIVTQGCGSGAVTYLWEARLGSTVVATSTDPSFTFSPADNGSYEVTLTASSGTVSDTDTVTINAVNLNPSITASTATQPVTGGPDVTLSGTITDAGAADSVTVSVVWETGGDPELISASGSGGSFTFSANHTYTTPGSKAISVTVADDDLGSAAASAAAAVAAALNSGTLAVEGAGGADDVVISSSGGVIQLQSSLLGGTLSFASSAVSLINIDLGSGNDSLLVSSGVTATILAFGGAGDDIIFGGGGSNVLVGGSGIDLMTGRGARDILIGGDGSDVLSGAGGQDILVDGATANDGDVAALLAILAEWNSGDDSLASFQLRVRHLSGLQSGGLNGSYLISALDNTTLDVLFGGAANDWIIQHSGDISF
jgi:hypothetical protein